MVLVSYAKGRWRQNSARVGAIVWPQASGDSPARPGHAQLSLLLKILDATIIFSVQVHPDDEYAVDHEVGEAGKWEAWYIIASNLVQRSSMACVLIPPGGT